MKKTVFALICLTTFFDSFSQEITVVDSTTKEHIAFAVIKSGTTGFYTNSKGEFNLKKIMGDSIQVYLLGYKSAKIPVSDVADTIFLKPEITRLEPIVVSTVREVVKIRPLKGREDLLDRRSEIVTVFIPNTKIAGGKIEEVNFMVHKQILANVRRNLRQNKIGALIRLHFYSVKEGKPWKTIFNSHPIEIYPYKNNKIDFDLSDQQLFFEKDGIAIGIELIGYSKDGKVMRDRKKSIFIRPIFSHKKSEYYTYRSFVHHFFNKDGSFKPLGQERDYKGIKVSYNNQALSIGFVLLK